MLKILKEQEKPFGFGRMPHDGSWFYLVISGITKCLVKTRESGGNNGCLSQTTRTFLTFNNIFLIHPRIDFLEDEKFSLAPKGFSTSKTSNTRPNVSSEPFSSPFINTFKFWTLKFARFSWTCTFRVDFSFQFSIQLFSHETYRNFQIFLVFFEKFTRSLV